MAIYSRDKILYVSVVRSGRNSGNIYQRNKRFSYCNNFNFRQGPKYIQVNSIVISLPNLQENIKNILVLRLRIVLNCHNLKKSGNFATQDGQHEELICAYKG